MTLAFTLALVLPRQAWSMECPNCALEFPSAWTTQDHPWGLRVWVDQQQVDLKVQPDELLQTLGPDDVAEELVWLRAELSEEDMVLEAENGRIVRTAAREPAVVLDYEWSDAQGSRGKGVRLVRRCGVRLIFEQRGGKLALDALLEVSDRVRYLADSCSRHNADVIPLEVIEGIENVRVPDMGLHIPPSGDAPGEPGLEPSEPEPPREPAEPEISAQPPGDDGVSGLAIGLSATLLGLLFLLAAMLRSGSREILDELPPLAGKGGGAQGRAPPSQTSYLASMQARSTPDAQPAHYDETPHPAGAGLEDSSPDPEATTGDLGGVADERTDEIIPAGTYGLRGVGGGATSERALGVEGVSEDLEASPPSDDPRVRKPLQAEAYADSEPAVLRASPVEGALATLGVTTWLDFTAPGVQGIAFLPSSVSSLFAVQNGGRFGYGWLLLLGLRRKNMDLMTLNGDSLVKSRFGDGFLVGIFAFGNVLWVSPEQQWSIRSLDGSRTPLGAGPEEALRALASDPELRDLGAPWQNVERCRAEVGELLPGWVYRPTASQPEDPTPVEIVTFLDLLAGG